MPLYTPSANALEPQRDANLACGMSMLLPGLGQLYNKEKRKALFFMATGCLNYLLLLLLIMAPQIMQSLKAFGVLNQFRLNQALVLSLEQLQLGSGACFALISLFIGFSIFAARDAYDRAQYFRRAAIYRDYVVGMPETTSGSYIFHISLLLACFILAFFFLIPAPPQSQITEIEFKQAEENTKEVQKTNNRAENNSKAGGKRDFSRSSSISSSSRSSQSSVRQAQVSAQAQSASALPSAQSSLTSAPIPQPTLQRVAQSFLQPKPVSTPPLSAAPSFTPSQNLKNPISSTPLPVVPLVASSALPALNIPRPSLAMPTSSASSSASSTLNMPKLPSLSSLSQGNTGEVKIASVPGISTSANSGGPVLPLPVGARSNNGKSGLVPAPSRSGSSGTGMNGRGPAVAPSVTSQGIGPGNQQGQNKIGNGDLSNPDAGRGADAIASVKEVDFSKYMAELQRRIKRAWFPPRDARSKRVKVIFKVHRNGEMTNLRLANSSGLTAADEAALKAIETAAPFHPLPPGAPFDVDIEFTFDYNVFNGGGTGSFRAF
ncbi:MAG: TonB family protein [Candidatus Melainabacteria bacterium]|nr:TonB family protein [Candidatus Melainabacteria bacterium]